MPTCEPFSRNASVKREYNAESNTTFCVISPSSTWYPIALRRFQSGWEGNPCQGRRARDGSRLKFDNPAPAESSGKAGRRGCSFFIIISYFRVPELVCIRIWQGQPWNITAGTAGACGMDACSCEHRIVAAYQLKLITVILLLMRTTRRSQARSV